MNGERCVDFHPLVTSRNRTETEISPAAQIIEKLRRRSLKKNNYGLSDRGAVVDT